MINTVAAAKSTVTVPIPSSWYVLPFLVDEFFFMALKFKLLNIGMCVAIIIFFKCYYSFLVR